MKNGFLKCLLLGLIVSLPLGVLIGCGNDNGVGKRKPDTGKFAELRQLVLEGKYERAITGLEAYVNATPTAKDASRAGLFLFKANVALGDLEKARQWCRWTIDNYGSSLESQKCQFKLGLILMAEGKPEEARQHFQKLSKSINPLRPESELFIRTLSMQLDAPEPAEAAKNQ